MTHLDWLILDATADDFESIVQIAAHARSNLPQPSRPDVARQIIELLHKGLLRQLERGKVSLEDLVSVPERLQPPFWFGMTTLGADAWEHSPTKFGSEPPDGSRAYSCGFDFAAYRGHCDGVSREVCLAAIRGSQDHGAVREETFRFEALTRLVRSITSESKVESVSVSISPSPNQSMEPTASHRTIQLCISSIRQSAAMRALARGGSSWSR